MQIQRPINTPRSRLGKGLAFDYHQNTTHKYSLISSNKDIYSHA